MVGQYCKQGSVENMRKGKGTKVQCQRLFQAFRLLKEKQRELSNITVLLYQKLGLSVK